MDRSGQVVDGKYRLISLLGTGGMGSVYEAEHVSLGKKVAVKFLHSELIGKPDLVARFQQEARAAAAIGHRNIVDVHDVGTAVDGTPFLVMEMLEGENLRGLLDRRGVLGVELATAIVLPVLSALAAAHRKGIIHRDIKPDNVFLERSGGSEPRVKLLDFGIAKVTEGAIAHHTRTGSTLGTPHYMAPEQARGETTIDRRADIYSMGVILYEALIGRPPFDAPNYNALMVLIMTERAEPMRALRPELPEGLEAVVERAMAKDRVERFAKVEDFLEALLPYSSPEQAAKEWLATSPERLPSALSRPAGPLPETQLSVRTGIGQAPRRNRGLGLLTGAAVLAVMGVVGVWVIWGDAAEPPAAVVPSAVMPLATPVATAVTAQAPAPPVDPPAAVTIALSGVPEGARVFFDGALVDETPLRVSKSDVMVPLRVEAEGHEPFSQMVIPDRDRSLEITLVRARSTAPGARQKRTAQSPASAAPVERETRGRKILTDTSEFR